MKRFLAKILVKAKPVARDIKCLALKQAIEKIIPIKNLVCQSGTFYLLNFDAQDQRQALHMLEAIAKDLLSNETVEDYEIKSLEEVSESEGHI